MDKNKRIELEQAILELSEMDKNQKTAFTQVILASNWILDGYENSVTDGYMEQSEMPEHDDLAAEIYGAVMTTTYVQGAFRIGETKEIRFAGAEFIKERIERKLQKEGY